jgi:hypothetical protein
MNSQQNNNNSIDLETKKFESQLYNNMNNQISNKKNNNLEIKNNINNKIYNRNIKMNSQ